MTPTRITEEVKEFRHTNIDTIVDFDIHNQATPNSSAAANASTFLLRGLYHVICVIPKPSAFPTRFKQVLESV
jgi:hypothetical protein